MLFSNNLAYLHGSWRFCENQLKASDMQ